MKKIIQILIIVASVSLVSWWLNVPFLDSQDSGEPIRIVASTSIVADAVRQVVGADFDIYTVIPVNDVPFNYSLTSADKDALTNADAVVLNGAGLEAQIELDLKEMGVKVPIIRMVDGVPKGSLIKSADFIGMIDPHFWNDIILWQISIKYLAKKMGALFPDFSDEINNRTIHYTVSLMGLNQELNQKVKRLSKKDRVYGSTQLSFQYLNRAFDFKCIVPDVDFSSINDSEAMINNIVEGYQSAAVSYVLVDPSIQSDTIDLLAKDGLSEGYAITYDTHFYFYGSLTTYADLMRFNVMRLVDGLTK